MSNDVNVFYSVYYCRHSKKCVTTFPYLAQYSETCPYLVVEEVCGDISVFSPGSP